MFKWLKCLFSEMEPEKDNTVEYIHPLYSDICKMHVYQSKLTSWYRIKIKTSLGDRSVLVDNGYSDYSCIPIEFIEESKRLKYYKGSELLFTIIVNKDGSNLQVKSDIMTTEQCLLAVKEALQLIKQKAEEEDTRKRIAAIEKQIECDKQKRIVDDFYGVK